VPALVAAGGLAFDDAEPQATLFLMVAAPVGCVLLLLASTGAAVMAVTSVLTAAFVFAEDDTALIKGQRRADTFAKLHRRPQRPIPSIGIRPARTPQPMLLTGRLDACSTPLSVEVGLMVKHPIFDWRAHPIQEVGIGLFGDSREDALRRCSSPNSRSMWRI
jgi:hypothetical protein